MRLAWTLTSLGLDASVGGNSITLLRLTLYLMGLIELHAVTNVEATVLKSMLSSFVILLGFSYVSC